ncbi:MAG: hypothetical protein ACYC56_02230 [Candidatus Aquicultor sp.]
MDSTLLTVGIFGVIAILAIGMFLKNTISFLKESRQPGDAYDEPTPRPQEQPKKVEPKVEAKVKPAVVVQPGRRPERKPVAAPAVPTPQPVVETKPVAVAEPQIVASEAAPAVPVVEPTAAIPQAPVTTPQPATAQSPSPVAPATAVANDTATALVANTTPTNGTASKDAGSVVNTDPKITTLGLNQIVMDLDTPKTSKAEAQKVEAPKPEAPKAEAAQPAAPAPQVAAAPTPAATVAAEPVAAATEAPKAEPVKAETAKVEKAATAKTDKEEKSLVTDTAKNAGRPPIRAQGPKGEDSKRIEKIQDTLAKYFEPQPVNDNHGADESSG